MNRQEKLDVGVKSGRGMRATASLPWLMLVFWLGICSARSEITPKVFRNEFDRWSYFGETNLFLPSDDGVQVTWDSSKPNSFYYRPLGFTVSNRDDFKLAITFQLSSIAIGTTTGKPYTFQIAAGLIHLTNAFDPEMFRGAGIHPDHGPRNLFEFNYFPDSGFGATVAPTICTEENRIAFSDNHPLVIEPGPVYRLEMSFTATNRTLESRIWKDGEPYGSADGSLKQQRLAEELGGFRMDAIALSSYSDAGQSELFAGSIFAKGEVNEMELTIYHRPSLRIDRNGEALSLRFETSVGWEYYIESSRDGKSWESASTAIPGTGSFATFQAPNSASPYLLFRVRGERS